MKKSLLVIAAALILALSVSGCGKKNSKSALTESSQTSSSEQTGGAAEKTEEQIKDEIKNFAKDSSKDVDMDKVKGTELDESDQDDNIDDEAELGSYKVEIEDAKLVNAENGDYIVVSFDFENKSSSDASFDQTMRANAFQSSGKLSPATVFETEGYNSDSVAEMVKPGKKITVQKAYKLEDTETDVSIEVSEFETTDGSGINKTFKLK